MVHRPRFSDSELEDLQFVVRERLNSERLTLRYWRPGLGTESQRVIVADRAVRLRKLQQKLNRNQARS